MIYRISLFILLITSSLQSHGEMLVSGGLGSQYGFLGVRGVVETKVVNLAACAGLGFVCAGLEKEFGENQNYGVGVNAGVTAFMIYQSAHINYYFDGYRNDRSWIVGLEVGQLASGTPFEYSSFMTISIARRLNFL